ncbi:PrsW family intramembrane metalloprotease [Streptomyces sp. 15-116A]|uniref:PrsW family intramembrane metalloprotease n=1 Tax=Streptomyces sp. 15-116A TaxID=2259035 RepID=UPI0021B20D8F|nr:PrsW family intramembrane metalloprotease [Streptomyces sp. 15-116A]MCT7351016.1 PrsW family intramembrane metalloprotease [Streptomyces sp. 15-116A]
MVAAAVYGVGQLCVVSWPTRSVRLSTVLLAMAAGMFACGTAAGLLELTYTRVFAAQTGRSMAQVVSTTSHTVAPWVEELVKATPLVLAGVYAKVRRQWGVTDFVLVGSALGAGFGLLEALLRYSLDADRAIARPDGGWTIPDSLSAPYIPGPGQVFTAWLPAPSDSLELGHSSPTATATFSHLVWTALAGLGVGLLWRLPRWAKPVAVVPVTLAVAHHTLNNYVAENGRREPQREWLEDIDNGLWLISLATLALAMLIDLRHVRRGKRNMPDVLLGSERSDGDSIAAVTRYAAWRLPWSLLIALRFVRLRRSLYYSYAAHPTASGIEPLRNSVAEIARRINATDHERPWRTVDRRAHVRAARAAARSPRRWLILVPCLLALPSVLFLGAGSFKSTVGLQDFFASVAGAKLLMGCAVAALAWIAWQLVLLARTWRRTAAQPLGEQLAQHRLRFGTAVGSATTGLLLLWRGLGDAGPDGRAIPAAHLLEALDRFLVYLGFALVLLSLLALFPPAAGLAFAGGGAAAGVTAAQAALAARLGLAGIALLAVSAGGSSMDPPGEQEASPGPQKPGSTDPVQSQKVGAAREEKVAELTGGTVPSGAPGKPGLKVTKPGAGTTDVDVIGADGSFIAVGGPAKARNLAKFGEKLHILKYAAEQRGVRAQVYLEEGTPDSALALARKVLGDANVHTFTR